MRSTLFLFIQVVVQVVSQATPSPPQNVHVNDSVLSWTPATEERDVTYTVQYLRFGNIVWKDVPSCIKTSLNSCDISLKKTESEDGCVMVRVKALQLDMISRPVKACSRHGDSCTPEVSLTARPGTLTVHLRGNHSMALENGEHSQHRVYYGKKGESLKKYKDVTSSVSIDKLEEGQHYCAKVQYFTFLQPVGVESCTQCVVIPGNESKSTAVVAGGIVVFLLAMTPAMAYILICKRGMIKRCVQPPCEIPRHFFIRQTSELHVLMYTTPSDHEHLDFISSIDSEQLSASAPAK